MINGSRLKNARINHASLEKLTPKSRPTTPRLREIEELQVEVRMWRHVLDADSGLVTNLGRDRTFAENQAFWKMELKTIYHVYLV